jgi:lysyl-tRNA synthetase class II
MLDHVKLEDSLKANPSISFKDIAEACHRGAIVGIEGYPGRTSAGEFTIVATGFNVLSNCDKNMPMMNWSHKKTLKDSELRFQK